MNLTYYGHSTFLVDAAKKLLFDPFITPNELAKNIDIKNIEADYILVSHGHVDHIADCEKIAKHTRAKVICGYEVSEWLCSNGVKETHPLNHGGKWNFDFGTVKSVNAIHSSVMPDGKYGGNPMGFVVNTNSGNFYYSGDTALTMDMQLIPKWSKLDFAVLCIGDNYTMGFEDAIEAARMIQCNKIVGVHYNTFEHIKINENEVKEAFKRAGLTLLLPAIGETVDV